jgi:hypothetical protein
LGVNTTHRIEAYRFGEIKIDGIIYGTDVIIFPERVQANWWRESGHSLTLKDLEDVIHAKPEILIVGRGANGRMTIPDSTVRKLEDMGIRLIPMLTSEACDEYNRLAGDSKVIAALHLTC